MAAPYLIARGIKTKHAHQQSNLMVWRVQSSYCHRKSDIWRSHWQFSRNGYYSDLAEEKWSNQSTSEDYRSRQNGIQSSTNLKGPLGAMTLCNQWKNSHLRDHRDVCFLHQIFFGSSQISTRFCFPIKIVPGFIFSIFSQAFLKNTDQ